LKRISVNRFRKPLNSISRPSSLFLMIFVILLTGGLIFIGIRGRLAAKSPLKPAAAHFCGIPLMHQLALNPAYTFMVSYLDSRKPDNRQIELMPVQEAIENARGYLVISDSMGCSPIARESWPARQFTVTECCGYPDGEYEHGVSGGTWQSGFPDPDP